MPRRARGGFSHPPSRRIRKRADFLRVRGARCRVRSPHFVFLLAPRPDPGPARLGIVATRKTGGAVRRNRAKRLVREAFRLGPDLLPAGIDLVVVVREGAWTLGLAGVRAEWQTVAPILLRRARELFPPAGPAGPVTPP